MKKILSFFVLLSGGYILAASQNLPPMEKVASFPSFRVEYQKSKLIQLPALPEKNGKVAALKIRLFAYQKSCGGCNFNALLEISDKQIGRFTTAMTERCIGGRMAFYELSGWGDRKFKTFLNGNLSLMFAPDQDRADKMSKDGFGGTFLFDISDLVRGVDGNTLKITNIRAYQENAYLVVSSVEVGYVDKKYLPAAEVSVPVRPVVSGERSIDGITLRWGKLGGFSVQGVGTPEVMVETALGMTDKSVSDLIVSDERNKNSAVKISVTPSPDNGFSMTALYPGLKIDRKVQIAGGLVKWDEKWTNTGKEIIGVPFRYRFFLRDENARMWMTGRRDADCFRAANASNPTYFLESSKKDNSGIGILCESDWIRLLSWWKISGGIAEIYTQSLALAPGKSLQFTISLTPEAEKGYWGFINGVRKRWKLNDFCVPRPIFWAYARANGNTPEEIYRNSLAHLGPVYVSTWPWLRTTADRELIQGNRWPRLKPGQKRTPGPLPDLDVEKMLQFEHRRISQQALKQEIEDIRKAAPDVKVMQWMHPSMTYVYKPMVEQWVHSEDLIRTADGKPFSDTNYDLLILKESLMKQGWGLCYFLPSAGSGFLQTLLEAMCDSMDNIGSEGIYSDEFSWTYNTRGYSRYDYRNWDGFSADLDENGKVVRLKSDNGYTTESAQLQMANTAIHRGKMFLGNGAASLLSVNQLPIARFIEGGYADMGEGHLNRVPLILGNFGDHTSCKGLMSAVRKCTENGSVYSPVHDNLILKGSDNFVCKLYPITVSEIGPGYVIGKERIHLSRSGSFVWPGKKAMVRYFRYNAGGELIDRDPPVEESDGTITVEVPENGLVIAEIEQ